MADIFSDEKVDCQEGKKANTNKKEFKSDVFGDFVFEMGKGRGDKRFFQGRPMNKEMARYIFGLIYSADQQKEKVMSDEEKNKKGIWEGVKIATNNPDEEDLLKIGEEAREICLKTSEELKGMQELNNKLFENFWTKAVHLLVPTRGAKETMLDRYPGMQTYYSGRKENKAGDGGEKMNMFITDFANGADLKKLFKDNNHEVKDFSNRESGVNGFEVLLNGVKLIFLNKEQSQKSS